MTMAGQSAPRISIKETEPAAQPIEGMATTITGFVGFAERGPLNTPTRVTSITEYHRIFGGYLPEQAGDTRWLPCAVDAFFNNGGSTLFITRVTGAGNDPEDIDRIIAGADGEPAERTGIAAMKNLPQIRIVAIPGITGQQAQGALISHCEEMQNRFAILDCRPFPDLRELQDQRDLFHSKYAALYYPWIRMLLPDSREPVTVPPSGAIAGIYVRTDIRHGVHKSPANKRIKGAIIGRGNPAGSASRVIPAEEYAILGSRGINGIREIPGEGVCVWGARTLFNEGPGKYVHVRRLTLFVEESIREGIRWAVFEPNDEYLWARVRAVVTGFLICLWRDGALAGTKPDQAFFVRCDRTTMSQDDIANGRLICVIGIAPLKPAEFLIFRIALWREGSAVTE